MVATKLISFLNIADSNNVVVGSWAEESGKPGIAICKYCRTPVKFALN